MYKQTNLQKNIGIFFGIIVICGVLGITIFNTSQSSSSTMPNNTTTTNTSNNTTSTTSTTQTQTSNPVTTTQAPPVDTPKKLSSVYKDGTYSATGSYMSPAGNEQIGVTIALKNDVITSATVTNMAGDGRSQRYQNMFISGYQQYVIGKNISSVYLTKISGSSLTPSGFNDALAQIESQAKA